MTNRNKELQEWKSSLNKKLSRMTWYWENLLSERYWRYGSTYEDHKPPNHQVTIGYQCFKSIDAQIKWMKKHSLAAKHVFLRQTNWATGSCHHWVVQYAAESGPGLPAPGTFAPVSRLVLNSSGHDGCHMPTSKMNMSNGTVGTWFSRVFCLGRWGIWNCVLIVGVYDHIESIYAV